MEIIRPSGPPDLSLAHSPKNFRIDGWLPTNDSAGYAQATHGAMLFSQTLPNDPQALFSDLEVGVTAINSPLQPVYAGLGMLAARTATSTALTLPHPEALNQAADAVPDEIIPIRFEAYDSDQLFPIKEELEQLRNRRRLIATEGWNALHDIAVHAVAYALLDDKYAGMLADTAGQALDNLDRPAIRHRGNRIDTLISADYVAVPAGEALEDEQCRAQKRNCLPSELSFTDLPLSARAKWLGIGQNLNRAIGRPPRGPEQRHRAEVFRSHCYDLIEKFTPAQ